MRLQACSRFHMVQIKYLIIVSRSPSSKQTRRIVKSQLQEEQDCKVPAPTLLADCREYPRLQARSLGLKLVSQLVQRAQCFSVSGCLLLFFHFTLRGRRCGIVAKQRDFRSFCANDFSVILFTGCAPAAPPSSAAVIWRWGSVFTGCWTETLPQHK